jgi:hypothetical protein
MRNYKSLRHYLEHNGITPAQYVEECIAVVRNRTSNALWAAGCSGAEELEAARLKTIADLEEAGFRRKAQ